MDLVSQNLLLTSGGGKEDPTYIEDVFSTHLYRGNASLYKLNYIANGIKLGTTNFGASVNFESNQVMYPDSANWDFGYGDFTVECWIRSKQSTSGYYTALGQWAASSNFGWMIRYASQDIGTGWSFFFSTNGSNYFTAMGSDISDGNWHHVAVSRSGGYLRTYTDGVRNTNRSTTETFHNSSETFKIGGQSSGSNYFTGLLSNVRVIKGTALYTGASFTPPTKALTNVTNTVFLGCQSPTDPTAATVGGSSPTKIGDPKALAVGPFTGSAADVKGGMVITKARTTGNNWGFYSTTQGHTKVLSSTSANGFDTNAATNEMISFDANGFTLGQDQNNAPNTNAQDISSWTFAKQKGFFDIVTYTGDGTKRAIAHSLGSVPGSIFIKRTDSGHNWGVYHRGLNEGVTPEKYRQRLNVAGQEDGNNANGYSYWADTAPTSTHFTVSDGTDGGQQTNTNVSGATYIAYIFAGGANTAATARSVDFDGSGDYLSLSPSSDFAFGTGDYTVECWIKPKVLPTAGYLHIIFNTGGADNNTFFFHISKNQISVGNQNAYISNQPFTNFENGNWYHIAACRSGTTLRLFVNGVQAGSNATDNINWLSEGTNVKIGTDDGFNQTFNGKISNFRVVKGTALYTSSFRPTYEPLTNITNTKLLCCNNSSTTGSTVTPGTITANGNPTASSDSPFDDPEGFKFGEEGDQNIIKCGNFVTDTTNGFTLELPWEPQWLFFKQNNANNNWIVLDSMRGWTADGTDSMVWPNSVNAEVTGSGYEKLLGNTIRFQNYGNNYDFMYIAVRRPDSLVAKPVEAGTEVFGIAYGAADSDTPQFRTPAVDVNDFTFYFQPAQNSGRYCGARLLQAKYWYTDTTAAPSGDNNSMYDYMDGFGAWTSNATSWLNYAWKRHAGFDVVNYTGSGTGNVVKHNLSKTPEMMWVKCTSSSLEWAVYHKGLNGGTNPQQNYLVLNTTAAEASATNRWNNTAPNANAFTVGGANSVGDGGATYIAMLFASVEGVSKVGSFTGTGATITITTGFRPRFLILRASSMASPWYAFDTTRGWGAGGNDQFINLNEATSQASINFGEPTATGFTINYTHATVNGSGQNIIYYAHA